MQNTTGLLSEESFEFKDITWDIPNFLKLPTTVGYCVTSPEFCLGNATWFLRLYTNGQHCSQSAGYIDIYLVRSQSSVHRHYVNYDIGLKTRRLKKFESISNLETFENINDECGISCYLKRSKIMAQKQLLISNGTLSVFCQIRVAKGAMQEASSHTEVPESVIQTKVQDASFQTEAPKTVTPRKVQETSSQTEVPKSVIQAEVEETSTSVQKLQLHYNKLLKSEEDSDVCLKVSGKEFRAHRCILRARSEVFSAMFKHETKERASGEVVIDDVDPKSFPDFLQHVYAGRVESLSDENVFNLYFAADKYDLQELKSECQEYMKLNLSVDNFCDVMVVSLRHKEDELLKLAIEYFAANFAEIVFTVNWQRFLADHTTEANELLIKGLVTGNKNK